MTAVAGVPDELERLWTPHRMAYVAGAEASDGGSEKPAGCPFCVAPTRPVDEGLVVARGDEVYAVLNLYPYNPGHLLICPYRHVAEYPDLDPAETTELARFGQLAMTVIRRVSGPAGFNLGMNQGHVAGAGIAAHLHQHVVPRWAGDTNFMPVIGRTKTLPQLLADTRSLLAGAWADVEAEQGGPKRAARYARKRAAPVPASAKTDAAAKSPARAAAAKPPARSAVAAKAPARSAVAAKAPARSAVAAKAAAAKAPARSAVAAKASARTAPAAKGPTQTSALAKPVAPAKRVAPAKPVAPAKAESPARAKTAAAKAPATKAPAAKASANVAASASTVDRPRRTVRKSAG
jgi:ATP adenylyltransferase